ncbi:F-box only protein 7 isoform X2 [Eucyclogobius newberryi]|uniref:F-box only protein 7 isoform X2 n=1 Tax=Eucyclogobius newberryi TaxID=166745 RepID=UPI003B5AC621
MNLRVRLNGQSSRVELPEEDPTLSELSDHIRQTLLPSQGLSTTTEFSLSLNGTEPLSGDGQTLSSCGIVSGDLICVILPGHVVAVSSSASAEQTHNNNTASQTQTQQTTLISYNEPGCSSSAIHSKVLESEQAVPSWEPMLCSEAEDGQAPLSLELLYHGAHSTSPSDAIIVVGHLLMLETGFTHEGCELQSVDMPAGWRGAGGVYKLKYSHALCENTLAILAAVCTGPTLVINATLKVNEKACAVGNLCLDPSSYVTNEWPGEHAAAAFKCLKKLSRIYKDFLAYPLIAAAREAMALPVAFGLSALPPELLLRVLRLLDVHSLTRLSMVSRHFLNTTSDSTLWKHLFLRDFRDPDARNRSRDTNWKELYRRQYKIHKECQQRQPHHYLPPYPSPVPFGFPPIFEPIVPRIIGDIDQRPFPIDPFQRYHPRSRGREKGFI